MRLFKNLRFIGRLKLCHYQARIFVNREAPVILVSLSILQKLSGPLVRNRYPRFVRFTLHSKEKNQFELLKQLVV